MGEDKKCKDETREKCRIKYKKIEISKLVLYNSKYLRKKLYITICGKEYLNGHSKDNRNLWYRL